MEEGLNGIAAINGCGFLNLKRDGLNKARKHEDRQSGTKSKINKADIKWRIESQHCCHIGKRKHKHLERDDH